MVSVYNSVLRSVHAGGNLNNGDQTGVAARNSNNDLSNANANNGSQLSYQDKRRYGSLPLGKTEKFIIGVGSENEGSEMIAE